MNACQVVPRVAAVGRGAEPVGSIYSTDHQEAEKPAWREDFLDFFVITECHRVPGIQVDGCDSHERFLLPVACGWLRLVKVGCGGRFRR